MNLIISTAHKLLACVANPSCMYLKLLCNEIVVENIVFAKASTSFSSNVAKTNYNSK